MLERMAGKGGKRTRSALQLEGDRLGERLAELVTSLRGHAEENRVRARCKYTWLQSFVDTCQSFQLRHLERRRPNFKISVRSRQETREATASLRKSVEQQHLVSPLASVVIPYRR